MTIKNSACVLLVLLISGCSDSAKPVSKVPRPNFMPMDSWEGDTPFILPGVKQPPTVAADATELADDVLVIGITAGTKHRAYSLKAMTHVASHVVNDVIDGTPVTVTYCDRTDTSRCFTLSGSRWPLDLELGGWKDQKVLFRLHNQYYAHDAKDIPLKDYEYERTTWGEWRQAHPDTDLYEAAPPFPGADPPPMKKIKTPKKIEDNEPFEADENKDDTKTSDDSKASEDKESKDGQ